MRRFYCAFVLAANLAGASAFAQDGRFYAGLSLGAENFDTRYEKNVLVGADAPQVVRMRVPMTDAGNLTRTSADASAYELGALAGYRRGFARDAFYWSAEVDVTTHGARARGVNPGTGEGVQRGENWAENWRFEKQHSYGLTLRLGKMLDDTTSAYLLGGARATHIRFRAVSAGCSTPTACVDGAGVDSFELRHDNTLASWRAGARLEKSIDENTAVRAELHYTEYENDERLDLFDFETQSTSPTPYTIRVPYHVESSALGFAASVVRYF